MLMHRLQDLESCENIGDDMEGKKLDDEEMSGPDLPRCADHAVLSK
jgi:hypothetical protein